MRLATWNVNSIRSRLAHLSTWLETATVDVVCLQETKVIDADFPEIPGWQVVKLGQKSYNGVAILSREPLSALTLGFGTPEWDEQKRLIAASYGDYRIVNVYVPNGSELDSDKYHYKLGWLQQLQFYLKTALAQYPKLILCGDFNVAPTALDIYGGNDKPDHIMASAAERQALHDDVVGLGLRDAFRVLTPEGGHYSWWDYRQGGFARDRGWRIDHIYISQAVELSACWIDKTPRGWEKPSDHTPVILDTP